MRYNSKMGEQRAGVLAAQVRSTRLLLIIVGGVSLLIGLVTSGVMVRRTNAILGGVVSSVSGGAEQIASASGQVSSASQSLAEGASDQVAKIIKTIDEVAFQTNILALNAAVGQMDKVTQSNAANAEESASAAEELNAQAEAMTEAVNELQQLVGGSQKDQARKPAVISPQSPAISRRTVSVHTASATGAGKPEFREVHGSHTGENPPTPPSLASSRAHNGHEIPMVSDFKDL